jgi:organic radical activating enzyme
MTGKVNKIFEIKKELDAVGNGFCLAKWYHVSMHLHTGQNHSCYHPTPHYTPLEEVKANPMALHNTSFKKEQRKLMLEGGRPDECSYCWGIEDLPEVNGQPNISDRMLRSSEPWTSYLLESTKDMPWDADVYPRYLELNFGNECQFKCSYCAPMASSKWYAETEQHGLYPMINPVNRNQYDLTNLKKPGGFFRHEDENPFIEAFWKWFPDAYKHLHVLRFTGGEPLLSKNVFKVMDYIRANPRPDLEFAINSNMCVPDKQMNAFLEGMADIKRSHKVRAVRLYTSVDSWGVQAEWIRNGMDIKKFEANLHRWMTEVPDSSFSFMITFCLLAIPNFKELLDKILEFRRMYTTQSEVNLPYAQRVTFDTPYTLEPPHLTGRIADEWFHERLDENLAYMKTLVDDTDMHKFSTVEYLKLQRTHSWIKENQYTGDELALNRKDFAIFVDEHDRRRRTDWHAAFPELKEFYEMCKRS